MLATHRPQLIQDLTDTTLGLIAEAELSNPQDARALIELACSLDRLRVQLIAETGPATQLSALPRWQYEKRH